MIWMITASDDGQLESKINEIRSSNELEDLSMIFFDGSRTDFRFDELVEEISTVSMFDSRKVIHVKNLPGLYSKSSLSDANQSTLARIIEGNIVDTFLIFSLVNREVDSRRKLIKSLKKYAHWIELKQLNELDIKSLIMSYNKQYKLNLSKMSINLLNQYCQTISQVQQAFDKLNLVDESIDEQLISKLIVDSRNAVLFDLSDAIISKNYRAAFKAYDDLKRQTLQPSDVLYVLSSKIRIIFQILSLNDSQLNEKEIVKQLGITPNYYWFLSNKQVHYFTKRSALRTLFDLAILDQKIKTSQVDKQTGFEMWLIEFMR